MVDIERDIAESVSRLRCDRCLRSFWRHEHVSMKMTVATAVHHTATSDVTQAPVNVYTTPAIVNAHVTASMCLPTSNEGKTESGHREDVYAGIVMASPFSVSTGHREPFPRNPALTSQMQGTVPGWHRPA